MRQLTLGITPPAAPTLDNFIPGANAELVLRLRELTAGRLAESIVYLWGEPGSGRSHLLRACTRPGVLVADDVQALDENGQVALFHRINEARDAGDKVLAAGDAPPAQLGVREDLRSRLAWGLVYQVKPLSDAERAQFLAAEAGRRGIRLADEVVWYLLSHVRRDPPSLLAVLEHLDRTSLERHRKVTMPLVREALKALER